VEEDPVARVREQHDDGQERSSAAEPARCEEPGEDRPRVQKRHPGLGQRAPEGHEESARDERRDRRAAEHVAEVDRVGLEELDECPDVGPEVPATGERHRDRLDPPDGQRGDEDGDRAAAGLGEGREPGELPAKPGHQRPSTLSMRTASEEPSSP
jgi:hypothetical protein